MFMAGCDAAAHDVLHVLAKYNAITKHVKRVINAGYTSANMHLAVSLLIHKYIIDDAI